MDAIPFIFPGPILSFLFFCVPQVTHFALLADQTDFLAFSSSSFLSRGLTRRRVLWLNCGGGEMGVEHGPKMVGDLVGEWMI